MASKNNYHYWTPYELQLLFSTIEREGSNFKRIYQYTFPEFEVCHIKSKFYKMVKTGQIYYVDGKIIVVDYSLVGRQLPKKTSKILEAHKLKVMREFEYIHSKATLHDIAAVINYYEKDMRFLLQGLKYLFEYM